MPPSAAIETPDALRGTPAFIDGVLRDWQVPGMAVAVAREGRIVFSQGFGLRNVTKDLPVTPRTLFAIGSCTKAFTTMGLGLLADEGKLDWDTPVATYLPDFALHDPFASDRITPRDLVTHRSGLPRHDLAWYGAGASRREIVDRLRHLQPTKDLRTAWQYQNLMYLAAGYLAGVIAGQEWEELVRQRIFDPLGMATSTFSVTQSQKAADFAHPYQEKDDRVREIPFRTIDSVGPAGSINSNIEEMASWLLLHLNNGRHAGEQFISEGQISQMHALQMTMRDPVKYAELSLPSYGLGWFVESYRGQTVVSHGGNIDGFSALVTFIPRQGIGVVALTNLNGVPVPDIVAYHVYDRLLGLSEISWNDRFLKDHAEQQTAEEKSKEKGESDRVKGTQPSHPLDAYAGTFAHPAYGTIAIERAGDELALRYNAFTGPLPHRHYDTFEFTFDLFTRRVPVSFVTDVAGDIASLTTPLEPLVPDIVFTRQPPPEMTETGFLERFVGAYALMEMPMNVLLKDQHALRVSLPGQPDYELEPVKGTTFRLKGLSGFSIEFTSDASGRVTDAIVAQPGGVFTAPKRS